MPLSVVIKMLKDFKKRKIEIFLVTVLLIFNFLIRLGNYQNLSANNFDGNRDFLVASHAIKYHELFLSGGWSSVLGDVKNSPVYYYILSALLVLKNSMFSLELANIFFQILSLFIIYLLAREMFGKTTAIIALLLFGFSEISIEQSVVYIWQPWVMQPFVNLSYLLLLFAYLKKNNLFLCFSVFVYILSGAIHNSVFSLSSILFAVLVIFVLKNSQAKKRHHILTATSAYISFMFFFLPLFIYWQKYRIILFPRSGIKINLFPGTLISHFTYSLGQFINAFFQNQNSDILSINNLLILFLAIAGIIFWKTETSLEKKLYLKIMLLGIILQLITVSLINFNYAYLSSTHPAIYGLERYFTPMFGITFILIAKLLDTLVSKNFYYKATGIFAIVVSVFVFSPNLTAYIGFLPQKLKNKTFFSSSFLDLPQPLINSISSNISSAKDYYKGTNFFQIEAPDDKTLETSVWSALENRMNSKFLKLSDASGNSYLPINKNFVTFFIYYQSQDPKNSQNNGLKSIYSDRAFIVYMKVNKSKI